MTQVGHSIIAAAAGVVCMPKDKNILAKVFFILMFIFLANVPDLPLPYWGHVRYDISHSFFVILYLVCLMIPFSYLWCRIVYKKAPERRTLLWAGLTIFSHLLMDSFYNHGLGIAIFWPVSPARLTLPIPWLSVQKEIPPPITQKMVRIWLIEFASFTPFLLLAIGFRTCYNKKCKTKSRGIK